MYMEMQGMQNSRKNLENAIKVGGLTLLNFKTMQGYKNQCRYWQKDRHIDQWNGTENPEINPYIFGQLISDKYQDISMEKEQSFRQLVLQVGFYMQKMKFDLYLTSSTNNQLKRMKP